MGEECNVRDFGAVGDGAALDTAAIQKAMDTCAQKGGGVVRFPAGVFKAGTLFLRSRVNLRLEPGATLMQSRDPKDFAEAAKQSYVHCTASSRVFLHGIGVSNVAIVGGGRIDGNRGDMVIGRDPRGPLSVLFENSDNLLLQDVAVVNSPGWSVTFFACHSVRILNVKCLNSFADGINPSCCQDVLYDGVLIEGSGDDAITIKNESPGPPPACGYLTKDIRIRNTVVRNTSHPAVKFGTGTFGVFRNVTVNDCVFENVGFAFAIQLMRRNHDPAADRAIENVSLANIKVKKVRRVFDITSLDVKRPVIRAISVENLTAEEVSAPSFIYGLPGAPACDLTFRNIRLTTSAGASLPFWLRTRHVNGLRLSNVEVRLTGGSEAGVVCENSKDILLEGVRMTGVSVKGDAIQLRQVSGAQVARCSAPDAGRFLWAEGAQTSDIRLTDDDLQGTKLPFDAASDVPAGAIAPAAQGVRCTSLRAPERIRANECFMATLVLQNAGETGAYKAEVEVDGSIAGSRWVWLGQGESREVTVTTRRYYRPERHEIKVGDLTAPGTVEPTLAAFEFGERVKVLSPAVAGELTTMTFLLRNIGGQEGSKEVTLQADGKAVASKTVALGPGEEKEVTLEHRFETAGPHALQVGDFPVWPFATFANTEAVFYWTRDGRVLIEAGGGPQDIRSAGRQYAAVYRKGVQGDFVAEVRLIHQTVTGRSSGGGLIVKNDMAKPGDPAGLVLAWSGPKYNVAGSEGPFGFRVEKKQGVFKGASTPVSAETAAARQDVGLFANANSERGEPCHAEFGDFRVSEIGAAQGGK